MVITIGRIRLISDGVTLFDLPTLDDLALPFNERVAGEEWRGLPDFPLYFVSSRGRVWSRNGKGGRCTMLRPTTSRRGYQRVMIMRSGQRFNREVHVLMGRAFLGPRPKGKQVAHSDDVKSHNVTSNLSYVTNSENQLDSVRNGTHANAHRKYCRLAAHPLTPENTIYEQRGEKVVRRCRICRTSQKAGYYLAAKAQELAVAA